MPSGIKKEGISFQKGINTLESNVNDQKEIILQLSRSKPSLFFFGSQVAGVGEEDEDQEEDDEHPHHFGKHGLEHAHFLRVDVKLDLLSKPILGVQVVNDIQIEGLPREVGQLSGFLTGVHHRFDSQFKGFHSSIALEKYEVAPVGYVVP